MTDNRTTELAATERICEQLEAAGVSFVRSEQIIEGTYWGVTWFVGETKFEFRENDKRTDLISFNATPEQAVAATLGDTTCEYVIEDNMNESEGMGDVWFRCTNCGTCYDYCADDWLLKAPYCPMCRATVKGVR